MICCHLQAKQTTRCRAPSDIKITTDGSNGSGVSPLTGDGDDEHTTTTTLTAPSSGPTHPKPKRKQIRVTASAVQQRSIDDRALKKHKSDAHKAAVRLYDSERKKPDGMSVRQVHAVIKAKYETCPSVATISRYVKQ